MQTAAANVWVETLYLVANGEIMKNSTKITLSAMMAALATVFMLLSYFPYLTYAIPAVAGLFIMVIVIEIDFKWAFLSYLTSAALVFLFAEPESKLMYICLFGYYPIIKGLVEKINKPVFEWTLKLICFFVAVVLAYFVFASLFGINLDDLGDFGKYSVLILLLFGTVAFVFYDIAVSKMSFVYFNRLHGRIRRIFK